MDISEIHFGTILFNFGIKRNTQIKLVVGEAIIISKNVGTFWHRKYVRKAYTLKNGKVSVQVL